MRVTAPAAAQQANHRWWTLVGTCLGLFVLMLDSTVVNVALTPIARDIGATVAGLQWVVNGYLLVCAATVVTAGRLGDIFGRRLVFLIGMGLFALGSVVCALSNTEEVLIGGRVIQGLGAAALVGLSLAIVSSAFPAAERPKALGIWASVSALALGIGPVLGGALLEAVSWRWLFWINLPICLAGAVIVLASTPEQRDETSDTRIDWAGLVTIGLGLALVVLAFAEAKTWGETSAKTLGALGGGIALLVVFWFIEHRVRSPIVDFSLFRNGPFFGASAAGFCLVGCYWAVMFLQPQYLQTALGHSALAAGAMVLPLTAPMIVISPLGGTLMAKVGTRSLMTVGMALGTAGLVVMALIAPTSGYGVLAIGYLLFGIALGCVYAPMSAAAMMAMPQAKAGIAAGVLAMNRVMAGALTLALAGAIFQHVLVDDLGKHETVRVAYTSAQSAADWLLVAICAIGTVLTYTFVRDPGAAAHERHGHFHFHFASAASGTPARG
jgi:EmrB/QacA subfamily drug resistance transporter